jgi:hypothetical protein
MGVGLHWQMLLIPVCKSKKDYLSSHLFCIDNSNKIRQDPRHRDLQFCPRVIWSHHWAIGITESYRVQVKRSQCIRRGILDYGGS